MKRLPAHSLLLWLASRIESYDVSRVVQHRYLQQRTLLDEEEDQDAILVPVKLQGDDLCPCLSQEELAAYNRLVTQEDIDNLGDEKASSRSYGSECLAHDQGTRRCSNLEDCIKKFPLPDDCKNSWCRRSWCYVDPNNCGLLHSTSTQYPDLAYSYSTCGFLDSFSSFDKLSSLQGKTLKVGFNANSGGWKGAYNRNGHFALDNLWEGPLVEFVKDAALLGGFELETAAPPEWLKNASKAYFGGSSLDLCVYATSLGYLDMCVASYSITTKRASIVGSFFEVGSNPVYMVTFADQGDAGVDSFINHVMTIFKPFTPASWLIIVVFVLPCLGLGMLFHEYGVAGSAFPSFRERQFTNRHTGEVVTKTEKIPLAKQVLKAIYMSFLSFTSESYDVSVITIGGKIHLLGIFSFLILVLAVYTANLAAILTTTAQTTSVSTIEEAVQAGYSFCATRTMADALIQSNNIDPSLFVPDPISEGGDGKPGFNCPKCASRERNLDFMKPNHNDPSLYCNAAFMSLQDLQVVHKFGSHCNKTSVGEYIRLSRFGIPLSSSISDVMSPWLYKMKFDGIWDKHEVAAEPTSMCAAKVQQEEGIGLTPTQLTGIWVIVFSFLAAGMCAKAINWFTKITERNKPVKEQRLWNTDQWGRYHAFPTSAARLNQTIDAPAEAPKVALDRTQVSTSASQPRTSSSTHSQEMSSHSQELREYCGLDNLTLAEC